MPRLNVLAGILRKHTPPSSNPELPLLQRTETKSKGAQCILRDLLFVMTVKPVRLLNHRATLSLASLPLTLLTTSGKRTLYLQIQVGIWLAAVLRPCGESISWIKEETHPDQESPTNDSLEGRSPFAFAIHDSCKRLPPASLMTLS